MDIKITNLPKSKIKIQIHLIGGEFSPYLVQASKELSKNLNIPGFRPGKAPQKFLEEHIGSQKLLEEGAGIALNKIFRKTVEEKKIKIIGGAEGRITKVSFAEFEGEVEVVVLPEVKLPDYKKIALSEPKEEIKVDKKEVEDSLLYLRKSRAKFIRTSNPAMKGDQIEVDYEIRSGGVKIENGEIKDQKIILGEGKFIPGFEEKLIGPKEDEEKSFSLLVPSDFWKIELREKLLDFRVKVKGVFKVEMPELNDDFAKSSGKFENKENLEKSVYEGMKMEKEEKEKIRWRNSVIGKIAAESKIDPPDVLIEEERNKILEDFKKNIEKMGISFDDYLSHLKKNFDDIKKDFLSDAEKRIRIILCIYKIANKENINVSEREVGEDINKILRQNPKIAEKFTGKEGENIKNYLRENILQRKVIEFLSKITKATK